MKRKKYFSNIFLYIIILHGIDAEHAVIHVLSIHYPRVQYKYMFFHTCKHTCIYKYYPCSTQMYTCFVHALIIHPRILHVHMQL